MNILLATIGSAGDVHPKIGLAQELLRRGHRVTLITGSRFASLCADEGVPFEEIAPGSDFDRTAEDPRVWHPTRGFGVLARGAILPAMRSLYSRIADEQAREAETVVIASSLCLGARIAQEKRGVRLATIHMQPVVLRSRTDRVGTPHPSYPRRGPRWLKNLVYWMADRGLIDRALSREVNHFRRELGLPPVSRLFDGWVHSPQLVLGLWPSWYGPAQPDWPAQVQLCGFPLYDPPSLRRPLPEDVEEFLSHPEAPVLFTAGSGHLHPEKLFSMAEKATEKLGLRALLVSPAPYQPVAGTQRVLATNYLPFESVLSRCRAIVHHGGVGTTARAIASGLPQVVIPMSFDQPDNALRVEAGGFGSRLHQSRASTDRLARVLKAELERERKSAATKDTHGIPAAADALEAWWRSA